MYVCEDDAPTPPLNKEETWLTPTVRCGPPGLEFQKDVILTIPHCAPEPHQWELCSHETKKVEGGKWRRLKKQEVDLLPDRKINMHLRHFCGEKISGKAKGDIGYVLKDMNIECSPVHEEF